jgi:hypothetical protein
MWNPFKKIKPEVIVERSKNIDWNKVKTLDEVTYLLSRIGVTRFAKVLEDEWNVPEIKHFLGTTITEVTHINGFVDKVHQYDEKTK